MEIDMYEYDDEQHGIKVLGSDQLLHILQYVPAPAIISFGMTCHRFYDVVNSDSLWAKICKREWGNAVVDAWPSSRRRKLSWKQLYGEMLFCGAVLWHHLNQCDMIPLGRASHSMNITAGKLLVFGGGCEGGRDLGDTWVTRVPPNLLSGVSWQRASIANPPARFGHSCVAVNHILVLFGGINDTGIRLMDTWINDTLCTSSSNSSTGDVEDISSWRLLNVTHSPLARGAHAGCYAGDKKVVIFGGIRNDGVRINDTWMLDLSQEEPHYSWQEVLTQVSPPPRSGHSLTWIGGKRMILFGGRGAQFEVLNDVWMLSLEGELPVWVELRAADPLSEAPSPRAGHSASLIFGGRVLIFGGEDSKRLRKGDVWLLDPNSGTSADIAAAAAASSTTSRKFVRKFWKKLRVRGQSPGKRSFHEACSLDTGHGVLIFGGMIDDASSTGLVFDSQLFLLQLIP